MSIMFTKIKEILWGQPPVEVTAASPVESDMVPPRAPSKPPYTEGIRLNLGCGNDYREGWVNIDMNADAHKVDLHSDVTLLKDVADQSCVEVLAQDVLEHIPRLRGMTALQEWNRVLCEGGWLTLRVPSLVHLLAPLAIFLLVVGSIYAGLATPTEAAALGVVGALVLAALFGRLRLAMLREAVENTMKSTAMIMLIVIGAGFLNFVMAGTGLTSDLTDAIRGLNLPPLAMVLVVVVFYLVLGCFMETLSMMIMTVPVVAPVMIALGFDPIWLGIVIIVLVETALITPPVGLNLFVVQSLRKSGSMTAVIMGSLPFVLALFFMVALLVAFPQLALWLPQVVG